VHRSPFQHGVRRRDTGKRHGDDVVTLLTYARTRSEPFAVAKSRGDVRLRRQNNHGGNVSILWIILIVILVLALLGFFSRGYR
jgi:hypothetical protein